MISIKVRGGTAKADEGSLCLSCRYATIVKGRSFKEELVECGVISHQRGVISFPVTSCNKYNNASQPSLHSMEDIAWVLRTDKKKKQIGFTPAKDLQFVEKHVLSEEEL